jgi:uncharacterized membrane protein
MRHSSNDAIFRIPWPAYIVAVLAAAGVTFSVLYLFYPVLSDTMATRAILHANDGRWNALYHAAPVVPGAEPLPRSSPDILYTFAPIALSEDPLLLEVELRDDPALHYWILSVFAPDLSTLFVTDDVDAPGKTRRKYAFVAPGVSRERADPEATLVELPVNKALLIMQYVPASAADRDTIDEMRRRSRLYELWMKL